MTPLCAIAEFITIVAIFAMVLGPLQWLGFGGRTMHFALALAVAFAAGILAAPQQRIIIADLPVPPLVKEILP